MATAFNPDALPPAELLFGLGVQAGAAEPTALTFWTHVSDGQPRTLRVWRPAADAGQVMLAHESTVAPNDGGFLKQRVTGLAPDTVYSYAFLDGEGPAFSRRSVVGRARTAYPADYLWPITVGATTCTNRREAPWVALSRQANEPLDVLLNLGDMSYNDGAGTPSDFRAKWRTALADPGYRDLLPTVGTYNVWDDHEFDNNFDPETMLPSQLQAARDAFFEHLPAEPNPANGKLWRSFRWGRTAEFFLLDCRSERRPSTRTSDNPQYMSPEQHAWFTQALLDSPAHFKVVLNSVPVVNFPNSFWAAQDDRWEGWGAARQRMVGFIEENNIRNVWFLSGDFHLGYVARLEAEQGFLHRVFDIAVGPGGNTGNPLAALAMSSQDVRAEAFPDNQFVFFHGRISSTTLVFDPLQNQVRVRMVDAFTGEVFFEQALSENT